MGTLTVTPHGLEVRAGDLNLLPEMVALAWLLDDHLCNGWTLVEACALGVEFDVAR